MSHGRHRDAVERVVAAGKGHLRSTDDGLVELARTTADQMDAAGDVVSSRVMAVHLSALINLRRAIGGVGPPPSGGKLAQLRRDHPRPEPS